MEQEVFALKPTLRGERCILRPIRENDLDALAEILADPEVLRLTGSVHSTAESLAAPAVLDEPTRAWYLSRNEQTDRLDLIIADAETDVCVGEIVLNDYDRQNASVNIRVLVGAGGRDRGIGTEAVMMLCDYAFRTDLVHRIALEVYAFNPRAQHVYARCGFSEEGVARDALRFDDEWIDAIVMSRLSGDPSPTRR